MFTKQQIKEAKLGLHFISWQPCHPKSPYFLVKVRGPFAYVRPAVYIGDGTPVKLNQTASAKLILGGLREVPPHFAPLAKLVEGRRNFQAPTIH